MFVQIGYDYVRAALAGIGGIEQSCETMDLVRPSTH